MAGKNTTPAVGTAWTMRDKRNRSILNNGRDKRETSGLHLRRGARVVGVVASALWTATAAVILVDSVVEAAGLAILAVDGIVGVVLVVSEAEEAVGAVVVSVVFAAGAEIAIHVEAHNTTSPAQA